MDVREKLAELIFESLCRHVYKSCKLAENIADDLIRSGVTVKENMEISDELLKQLKNAPITICKEEPLIETVQEWVSAKDRLPEHGDVVLVWHTYMEHPFVCQWDERSDCWIDDKWTFGRNTITHWMPLPKPPKGE